MRGRDYGGFNRSFDRDYRAGDARNEKRSACTREAKCSHRARSPALYVITQPREGSFYRPPLRVYSTTPSLHTLSVPRILRQPLFHAARLPGEHTLTTSPNTFRAEERRGSAQCERTAALLNFIMYSTTALDRSNDIASRIFLYFPLSRFVETQ